MQSALETARRLCDPTPVNPVLEAVAKDTEIAMKKRSWIARVLFG